MKMIASSVKGVCREDGFASDYENNPLDIEKIVYISKHTIYHHSTEYRSIFCITFYSNNSSITWHYEDELTRDNRFEEILQYLNTKIF